MLIYSFINFLRCAVWLLKMSSYIRWCQENFRTLFWLLVTLFWWLLFADFVLETLFWLWWQPFLGLVLFHCVCRSLQRITIVPLWWCIFLYLVWWLLSKYFSITSGRWRHLCCEFVDHLLFLWLICHFYMFHLSFVEPHLSWLWGQMEVRGICIVQMEWRYWTLYQV